MNVLRLFVVVAVGCAVIASGVGPVSAAEPPAFTAIDLTVQLAVGISPYRPVLEDVGQDPYYESSDDCTISGRELLFGANLGNVRGCGGIQIDATLHNLVLPGDPDAQWRGGAIGTVSRRYGCVDKATGNRRVTLVRSTRQSIDNGSRDPVLFPGQESNWLPTIWTSPLEKVTCRTSEDPAQLSIKLCHLVLTATNDEGVVLRFPVAGTWVSRSSYQF